MPETQHKLPTADTSTIRLVSELPYSDAPYGVDEEIKDLLTHEIKHMDDDLLIFHNDVMPLAGLGFFACFAFGIAAIQSTVGLILILFMDITFLIFSIVMLTTLFIAYITRVAFRFAMACAIPTTVFSKRLQKVLFYNPMEQRYEVKNYKTMKPTIRRSLSFSVGGVSQWFTLNYAWVDNMTDRNMELGAMDTHMNASPEGCMARWRFIRTYMEGNPEQMPAYTVTPDIQDIDKESLLYMYADKSYQQAGRITQAHRINSKNPLYWLAVILTQTIFATMDLGKGFLEAFKMPDPLKDEQILGLLNNKKDEETASDKANTSSYKTQPMSAERIATYQGKNASLKWRWRYHILVHVLLVVAVVGMFFIID